MSRLGATDALFKYAESRIAPMNMGSVLVLAKSRLPRERFFADFKSFVGERLRLLPKMTKRLVDDGIGLPVWVDAGEPDLDYHVRRTALRSSDERELFRKLGRLQHIPFDFSRPLFMFYVIDDLPEGRIVLMEKFHHAFADGKTALRLVDLLSDEGAERLASVPDDDKQEAEAHGRLRRITGGALEDMRRGLSSIPGLLGAARAASGEGASEMAKRMRSRPLTLFNRPLSARRQFAFRETAEDQFTRVRRAAGLTFVEMALALLAGALRRYLDEIDELPDDSLVCNVPVALDSGGKTSGNAVVSMWVPLGTDIEDRIARAGFIRSEAQACKSYLGNVVEGASTGRGVELPSLAVRMMALNMGSPLLARLNPPPGNVALSSVPSPSNTIHVAGRAVEAMYGMPMVLPGQAVSVTISAYAGRIVSSILCCEKALPEPERLLDYMSIELDAYAALLPASAARRRRAARAAGEVPTRSRKENRAATGGKTRKKRAAKRPV